MARSAPSRPACTIGLLVACLLAVRAQSLSFEVASIKRSSDGSIGGDGARRVGTQPGGRFVMTDGSALVLVRSAFPDAVEVIGAPDWASSEHFDVEARAAGPVTNDQMNGMLRSMLADRFKFVSHIETRERPVYVLMLARSDGRLGPGIRLYDGDCQAAADAARQGRARPQLPTPANGAPACGYSRGGRRILAGGITMAALARTISSDAERTVIDQTGLAGLYEFSLEISPDVLVFTVVREQLGLKLEPGRAPLPVLVIDRLERPTED